MLSCLAPIASEKEDGRERAVPAAEGRNTVMGRGPVPGSFTVLEQRVESQIVGRTNAEEVSGTRGGKSEMPPPGAWVYPEPMRNH